MGIISCYALFGRRSKMARTVSVVTATTGADEVVEAVDNVSSADQQDLMSHLVIDCPIHDDTLLNEQPGYVKAEQGASGRKNDVIEIVVDIDKLSSFSEKQCDDPANLFDELNGSQQISNLGSSCSQDTCHGGVSLGEGSSIGSLDGQGDVVSGASDSPHIDRSPEIGEGHSYSDYGDQAKLDRQIARSEDGDADGLGMPHPILQMCKTDGDKVPSGHASDSSVVYAREHIGESAISSGGEREFSFVQLGGSCSDDMESSLGRVKAWVNSIQLNDMVFSGNEEDTSASSKMSLTPVLVLNEARESSVPTHQGIDMAAANHTLQSAAVRSLHPSSTVAHISGIGFLEVPPLGMFTSLRTLNLSANGITHVPVGCLPRGLHSLDLSRNRIAQIEGFRELTRLRVLNVSYNRISRIGHGLANCTLIKELYLAGNKIAEVEGLHRLLKLAVLDLSYNKITTSKALGQLAANYGSLLALNLVGSPILTNFSEDQLRKLVTALTPHLTYLNRQPIRMVSIRGSALDSIARAALGTSQRSSKSKVVKKSSGAGVGLGHKKLPPHHHTVNHSQKVGSASSSSQRHHHLSNHQHRHHTRASLKEQGPEPVALSKLGGGLRSVEVSAESRGMHRSKSASILQE